MPVVSPGLTVTSPAHDGEIPAGEHGVCCSGARFLRRRSKPLGSC